MPFNLFQTTAIAGLLLSAAIMGATPAAKTSATSTSSSATSTTVIKAPTPASPHSAAAADAAVSARPGHMAPDFTLPDAAGKNHSLSQYRGKWVVLEWVNYDCPFVKKHYKTSNMPNLQKAARAKGAVWLSINSSAPGKQGHFVRKELIERIAGAKANHDAYLVDPDGTVGQFYKAKTTPSMFVIDPTGKVVYAGAIDDKASADPDDIAGAKNYVKLALEAGMAGKAIETASTTSYGCGVKYK